MCIQQGGLGQCVGNTCQCMGGLDAGDLDGGFPDLGFP
jgi:hypothetical protein